MSLQLVEQYVRLCTGCPALEPGTRVEISLAQVADIFCCTLRNATLTLKKMQNLGWLMWQPGRGRGHLSSLTCFIGPSDLVFSTAKELVQRGEIHASRQLIGDYQNRWPGLEDSYARWMSSQFGLSRGAKGTRGGDRVDTLRLFVDRPFGSLDPVSVLLRSQTHLVKQIFDTLVRFDPVTRTIEPQLAFSWDVDETGRQWIFYLRKGVLFHHGLPLTAEDVCFSLRRLMDKPSLHRWLLRTVEDVQPLDDYAVAVMLKHPDDLLLHALSKEYAAIVPRGYSQDMGESFPALPVGSGPFKVVRNDDSMLVLEAFQSHFAGRPFLDRVELWCVPGLADETAKKQVQLLENDGRAQIAQQRRHPDWHGLSRREQCFQYVSLNGRKPGVLQQPAFRQALASLLDGSEMRADLQGSRHPVEGWGDAGLIAVAAEAVAVNVGMVAKECGYTGEPLRMYTYPDPDHEEDALWIQKRCAASGIAVEIVYAKPEDLAKPELMQSADLVLDSANVDEREELSMLELVFAETLSIYHHLDEAGRSMIAELAAKERQAAMNGILTVLRERNVLVPLYSNRIEREVHPRLCGLSLDSYGWIDYSRVFVRFSRDVTTG